MRKTTHGLDGRHQDVDRTPVKESIRMTEDRDKWGKYVHGVANPRIEDGERTEQNSPADVPGNRRVLGTVSQSARRVNPDYTAATCSEAN